MATIDISRYRGVETSTLVVDGSHVLTQRVRLGGRSAFPERPQTSFALRDGILYRTPSATSGLRVGFRFGGPRLKLGNHPIADALRSLGLPKRPLFSMTIGHLSGQFDAPQIFPAPPGCP